MWRIGTRQRGASGFDTRADGELAEIDENLIRSPLTPAEEASAIFRRKAIYEALHPETRHGGDRKSDQVANSATRFTASTSEATGKSERAVQIAAARGEALGADLDAVTGTSLDKGVELDALAYIILWQ
jgi:ParB family chromosome partitioning protein